MAHKVDPQARAARLALVAALVAASALAGCGRRGPLELPPGVPVNPTASDAQVARTQSKEYDPGLIQPPNKSYQTPAAEKLAVESNKPTRPINAPLSTKGKPFILDPLL